jgi:hypothetical protein
MSLPIDPMFRREIPFVPSHFAGRAVNDSWEVFAIFGFGMKIEPKNGLEIHRRIVNVYVLVCPAHPARSPKVCRSTVGEAPLILRRLVRLPMQFNSV